MKRGSEISNAQIDLRGFRYALEPLRKKREWELDELQREVARATAGVEAAQAACGEIEGRLYDVSASVAEACLQRINPVAHRQSLAYLARLQQQLVDARAALSARKADKADAMARCIVGQQKVELLVRHRDDALRDYAAEQSVRQAGEADGDWLMRRHWRAASHRDAVLAVEEEGSE